MDVLQPGGVDGLMDMEALSQGTGVWFGIQPVLRHAIASLLSAVQSSATTHATDTTNLAAALQDRDAVVSSMSHDLAALSVTTDALSRKLGTKADAAALQEWGKRGDAQLHRVEEAMAQRVATAVQEIDARKGVHAESMAAILTDLATAQDGIESVRRVVAHKVDHAALKDALELKANKISVATALHRKATKTKVDSRVVALEAKVDMLEKALADERRARLAAVSAPAPAPAAVPVQAPVSGQSVPTAPHPSVSLEPALHALESRVMSSVHRLETTVSSCASRSELASLRASAVTRDEVQRLADTFASRAELRSVQQLATAVSSNPLPAPRAPQPVAPAPAPPQPSEPSVSAATFRRDHGHILDELNDLRSVVRTQTTDHRSLDASVAAMRSDVAQLSSQVTSCLSATSSHADALSSVTRDANQSHRQLQAQVTELTQHMDTLTASVSAVRTRMDSVDNQIDAVQRRASASVSAAKGEHATAAALQRAVGRLDRLASDVETVQDDVRDLQRGARHLQSSFETLEHDHQKLAVLVAASNTARGRTGGGRSGAGAGVFDASTRVFAVGGDTRRIPLSSAPAVPIRPRSTSPVPARSRPSSSALGSSTAWMASSMVPSTPPRPFSLSSRASSYSPGVGGVGVGTGGPSTIPPGPTSYLSATHPLSARRSPGSAAATSGPHTPVRAVAPTNRKPSPEGSSPATSGVGQAGGGDSGGSDPPAPRRRRRKPPTAAQAATDARLSRPKTPPKRASGQASGSGGSGSGSGSGGVKPTATTPVKSKTPPRRPAKSKTPPRRRPAPPATPPLPCDPPVQEVTTPAWHVGCPGCGFRGKRCVLHGGGAGGGGGSGGVVDVEAIRNSVRANIEARVRAAVEDGGRLM